MNAFFRPNIGTRGRLVRGTFAILLGIAAVFAHAHSGWFAAGLAAAAAFCAWEALRGWCVVRACGLRTPF